MERTPINPDHLKRRGQRMLILVLALLLAVPPLALVRSGVVQAQAVAGSWTIRASMSTAR